MNKWWADEDLLQLLLNLHINETFEMAQLIGKKWTLSLIMNATVVSVWTLWIMGEGGVVIFTPRGYCLAPIEALLYILYGSVHADPHWPSAALICAVFLARPLSSN